jgi:hypothetical protein
MKIAIEHHTSKANARERVEQKLGQLLGQFAHHAEELEHDWHGDTLEFKGKARGVKVHGTVDVTDAEIVIDAKLPLIAMPFEGRIKEAVKKEADALFRTA